MEFLKNINESISGVVWGFPMLILLLGAGVYLSDDLPGVATGVHG